jgi:hypothetical protein
MLNLTFFICYIVPRFFFLGASSAGGGIMGPISSSSDQETLWVNEEAVSKERFKKHTIIFNDGWWSNIVFERTLVVLIWYLIVDCDHNSAVNWFNCTGIRRFSPFRNLARFLLKLNCKSQSSIDAIRTPPSLYLTFPSSHQSKSYREHHLVGTNISNYITVLLDYWCCFIFNNSLFVYQYFILFSPSILPDTVPPRRRGLVVAHQPFFKWIYLAALLIPWWSRSTTSIEL